MTDTAVQQIDATVADLVNRLAKLQAEIAEATAEAEGIKDRIRDILTAGDYAIGDRPVLRVTPTRKFDEVAGLQLVPLEDREACLAVKVDAAKVKQHLNPVQVEACMVDNGKAKIGLL